MPTTVPVNTLAFFVNRTRRIYSLPAVAIEVLELTDHPRVDCPKLKACIERDPALVSKILRVVNSSLFGLNREVSDLNQALALLGIKPLKLLVLGFSLSEAIFHGATGTAMEHAWRHTLTRAIAARELCETVWDISGDEAFIAALVAELGKFVLLDELGDPYANLIGAAIADHDDLTRMERESLGFDHIELSAELLSHWKLPVSLVGAVRISAQPDKLALLERPENLLPTAVRMAGLIADLVVDGRSGCLRELVDEHALHFESTLSGLDELRVSAEHLEQLVARVQDRVGPLAEVLSFQLPPGQDYRDVLAAAHERLALLAADAACLIARQWPITEKRGPEIAGLSTAVARYVTRFTDEPESTPSPHKANRKGGPPKTAPPATDVKSIVIPPVSQDLDAKLLERLTTVVALCRQARCALSLVLVELDRFRKFVELQGPIEAKNHVRRLHEACVHVDHAGAVCLQLSDSRFALVIADCDRRTAVQLGEQLLLGIRALAGTELSAAGSPTLSVGLATVGLASKNFPPVDLFQAATRCLETAQLSGGNTLKSIDVY